MTVVILTNRVYFGRTNDDAIYRFRIAVHEAVARPSRARRMRQRATTGDRDRSDVRHVRRRRRCAAIELDVPVGEHGVRVLATVSAPYPRRIARPCSRWERAEPPTLPRSRDSTALGDEYAKRVAVRRDCREARLIARTGRRSRTFRTSM